MTRTRDDAVVGGDQFDVAGLDVLVPGRHPLLGARQVDPQLDAVEEAALGHQFGRGLLDVLDSGRGGHPLGGAVGDEAAAAGGVLVLEGAVDDVGDGLESAVGVPGGALRLAGRVLDGAHVVEEQEGVGQGQVDAGEGAADLEALAFQVALRGDDPGDAAPVGLGLGQDGQAGQGQWVGRHGGHGVLPRGRVTVHDRAVHCSGQLS